MQKLIELAQKVGQQLARHDRTQSLKKAQQLVADDPQANTLVEEYHKQINKIAELERQNKPIEVDDKHKLQEIEEKIKANSALGELTRRQADFMELMQKVKHAIDDQLETELKGNNRSPDK